MKITDVEFLEVLHQADRGPGGVICLEDIAIAGGWPLSVVKAKAHQLKRHGVLNDTVVRSRTAPMRFYT